MYCQIRKLLTKTFGEVGEESALGVAVFEQKDAGPGVCGIEECVVRHLPGHPQIC